MLKSRLRKLVQGYPNRSTSCTLARAGLRTKLLSSQAKSGRIARGFGDRVSTSTESEQRDLTVQQSAEDEPTMTQIRKLGSVSFGSWWCGAGNDPRTSPL